MKLMELIARKIMSANQVIVMQHLLLQLHVHVNHALIALMYAQMMEIVAIVFVIQHPDTVLARQKQIVIVPRILNAQVIITMALASMIYVLAHQQPVVIAPKILSVMAQQQVHLAQQQAMLVIVILLVVLQEFACPA